MDTFFLIQYGSTAFSEAQRAAHCAERSNFTPLLRIKSAQPSFSFPNDESSTFLVGPDSEDLTHKSTVVKTAVAINPAIPADPVDVLAKISGFEIRSMCRLILEAATLRKSLIIDGFFFTAGALLAHVSIPASAAFMEATVSVILNKHS